jgi:hypothetical protein
MKKTVKICEQTALEIDACRGRISRSKFLDALLKKYQGVTRNHTHTPQDCKKSKIKPQGQ